MGTPVPQNQISTVQGDTITRDMIDEMIHPRRMDSAIVRITSGEMSGQYAEVSLVNPSRSEWPEHEVVITSSDLRNSNAIDHSWDEPLTEDEYDGIANWLMN